MKRSELRAPIYWNRKLFAYKLKKVICQTEFLQWELNNKTCADWYDIFNDLVDKIRIAEEFVERTNHGLSKVLQTSKFELSRVLSEDCHLRSSVERNQSNEVGDASHCT